MRGSRLNLPNIITALRIAATPAIFFLALASGVGVRFAAFVLFVLASLSDLWDGYLARKHQWITDLGKLMDPLADKLLLVSTFVPFYILSRRPSPLEGQELPLVWGGEIPWWGELPLWVILVIFGRELLITVFRSWAKGRGVVIAAGPSGKYKAFVQNMFCGGLLLWYPLLAYGAGHGWEGALWTGWLHFHGAYVGLTLLVALVLTVYSMLDYFWSYRSLMARRE